MAYYPLKVKDSTGTVHVVGDPRVANGGTQAPVASITGGWSSLTVAGKTLTLNSSAATGATETESNFARLTGFIGLTAKFTLPSCSFTARVLGVKTISTNVRTMVLDDIQMLTGSYPADGAVSISGTWIEDAGNFAIVRDTRVDLRDHVNVSQGKDVIFDSERELLFQITGPVQTTQTSVAPLTAWSNVYTIKNVYPAYTYEYPGTAIVATWTGATGAARMFTNWPASANPISYTTSGGTNVSFTLNWRRVYRVTSGTYNPADANSQYSIAVSTFGGAGEDLINGAQYFFFLDSTWGGSVTNAVNLDTNAWGDGQQNVHSPVTNFSWGLPPTVQHKWPTTVQNPRSKVLNHPLYRAGQYGDVMSVRLAGEPSDKLRSVPLYGSWITAEDGNFLVSNSANGNVILGQYGTGSYVYPIDVYAYAEESSSIKFRGRDSELAGISYQQSSGTFTAKGSDLVTSGAAIRTLHVMGEGTPFGQIDNSTLTTTLLTNNYQDSNVGYVQSLWLHTFKLTSDTQAAFWASPILATSQSHWNYYPVFYSASPRSDLCDFWRIRDKRPYQTVNVNGTNYNWVSFDATTKTISVVSPKDLSPNAGIPGAHLARPSANTVFRMIPYPSNMYYLHNYGSTPSSTYNGLSNGLLNQTYVAAPPKAGYSLTSVNNGFIELKWRPSPGIVTQNTTDGPLNPLSGTALDAFGEDRLYGAKVRALYRFGLLFKTNLNLYLAFRKPAEAWDWTEGSRIPMHYVTTRRAVASTTTTTHASGSGTASDTVANLAQLAGSTMAQPQVFVDLTYRMLGTNDYSFYFEADVFVQDTSANGLPVQVYRTTGSTTSGLWGPKIELFAGTTATTGIEQIEGRTRIIHETVDW